MRLALIGETLRREREPVEVQVPVEPSRLVGADQLVLKRAEVDVVDGGRDQSGGVGPDAGEEWLEPP